LPFDEDSRHACMILGFTKHAWGKHDLFMRLGGGIVRFIGENLGRTKNLRYLILFFFSRGCFLLWGFNRYKEWIIQLDWKDYKL